MKKNLFFVASVMCIALVLTSCGNKVDRALDKYERIVNKALKAPDPLTRAAIFEDAEKIWEGIDEDDFTAEQTARMLRISKPLFEKSAEDVGNMIGAFQDVSNMFDSSEDSKEDISGTIDNMTKGFNKVLDALIP